MTKLLRRGWVWSAALLALPFLLLAATHIVGRAGVGGDLALLLLLLCVLSVYVSFYAGILTLVCGVACWFLTVVRFRRGELIALVLLSCADVAAGLLWMVYFVRDVRIRY